MKTLFTTLSAALLVAVASTASAADFRDSTNTDNRSAPSWSTPSGGESA